jgi:hypothetical protein
LIDGLLVSGLLPDDILADNLLANSLPADSLLVDDLLADSLPATYLVGNNPSPSGSTGHPIPILILSATYLLRKQVSFKSTG